MTSPSIDPHAEARAQLEGYVHGLLDEASARRLEGHLRTCAACSAAAREERRLHELLGAAPAPVATQQVSPDFEARFVRRFRAEVRAEMPLQVRVVGHPASWWARFFGGYRWTMWVGAATATAVALAVMWPATQSGGPDGARDAVAVEAAPAEVSRELLSKIELLQNLDLATHLDVLEDVAPEELDAIAELPELGG